MSLDDAIEQARVQEQEKEAISLKVPSHIKQKLQKIADENKVSMNNLISSILSDVLHGSVSNNAYELYNELKEVSDKIYEITNVHNGIPFKGFSIVSGAIDDDYTSMLIDRYYVLKSILGVKEWKYQ